jgi:hypothetical protein
MSFGTFLALYLFIGAIFGIVVSIIRYQQEGIPADAGQFGVIMMLTWPIIVFFGLLAVLVELFGWISKVFATTIVPFISILLNRTRK